MQIPRMTETHDTSIYKQWNNINLAQRIHRTQRSQGNAPIDQEQHGSSQIPAATRQFQQKAQDGYLWRADFSSGKCN